MFGVPVFHRPDPGQGHSPMGIDQAGARLCHVLADQAKNLIVRYGYRDKPVLNGLEARGIKYDLALCLKGLHPLICFLRVPA